jgi:hypothetical protein
MKKQLLSIFFTLLMTTLTAVTANAGQQTDAWRTAGEIRNTPGVYIKRGESFLPLGIDEDIDWYSHTETVSNQFSQEIFEVMKDVYFNFYLAQNPNYRPPQVTNSLQALSIDPLMTSRIALLPTDRLVYVGGERREPRLYIANFEGYIARDLSLMGTYSTRGPLSYVNIDDLREPGFIQFAGGPPSFSSPFSVFSERYTHLNGEEITGNPLLETNVFWRGHRMVRGTGLMEGAIPRQTEGVFLTGNPGQIFTFGRWEGTNWQESEVTVNRELYTIFPIEHEVERTLEGYFYLNFPKPENGYLVVDYRDDLSSHPVFSDWQQLSRRILYIGDTITATTNSPVVQQPAAPNEQPQTSPLSTGGEIRLEIGSTTYTVNGQPFQSEAPPFIAGGRTMIPLRLVAEALGAEVGWNGETRQVTISQADNSFTLILNRDLPNNMGTPVSVNGRTFVPIAYIADMLGAQTRWDAETQNVYISFQ